MKRLLTLAILLCLTATANAGYLGQYANTDSLVIPIPQMLDTLGRPITPDSIHLDVVNAANVSVFTDRSSTYPFTDLQGCDSTTAYAGNSVLFIRDQVTNLNGAATTGSYMAAITTFITQNTVTLSQQSFYHFNVFATSPYYLNNTSNLASAAIVSDSVWSKTQTPYTTANTFGEFLDATISSVGGGSAPSAAEISDSVWSKTQSAYVTAGQFGYLLDAQISTLGGSGVWTTQQRDSALAALADANIGDKVWTDYGTRTLSAFGFNVTLADGSLTNAKIAANAFDAANFAASSLNGKGDWTTDADVSALALEASVQALRDTAQHLVTADVSALALASELAKALDSLAQIIDTLQNQDDWVATEASVQAVPTATETGEQVYVSLTSGVREQDFWADISSLATGASTTAMQAAMDSLRTELTVRPGSAAYAYRHADVDSLVIKQDGTRWGKIEFWHPGESAGAAPDTTKRTQ